MGISILALSSNLNTTSYICIMDGLHSFPEDSWHAEEGVDAHNIEAELKELFPVDALTQIHLNITN